MGNKCLFCVVLLFLASLSGAQEYYVQQVDGETRFVQRLVWKAEENVWRYEVVIEEFIRDDEPPESGESLEGGELPASGELSVSGESPESGELSASGELPVSGELSASGELPASGELSASDESLEGGELSGSGELSVSGESLEGGELSASGESPGSGELPASGELSGAGELSVSGEAPESGELSASGELSGGDEALEERGTFTEVLREFTGEAFIEVSLPPGIYRYSVTAYDFLERPGTASEWARLLIIEALEPEVYDFSPRVFYVDGDAPWVLNLTGRNLSPDAEVYLEYSEKNWVIVPREYTGGDSLSTAQLVFDIRQLVPGNYEIHIKNPGGLNTSAGTLEIGFTKSLDMYIEAAYTPLVPLYGELDRLEKKPIFPLGAAVRFGVIPFKKPYGYFGVELGVVWNYLSSGGGENKVSYHVAGAEVNILYQKWLSNRVMAFTFRAGGGLAWTTDKLLPRAEIGASFLWLIHKPFFMEAGLDGVHWFAGDRHSPGYLRPWLGGGVKL